MEQARRRVRGDRRTGTRSSSSTTGRSIDTWAVLQRLAAAVLRSCARCGIARDAASPTRCAPATSTSRGDVLVFYPADLQFKPEDIPRLVAPILAGESDMVTGFKEGKYEKAFVSGHLQPAEPLAVRRAGRDLNSVKAYRREIMDALPIRPDWHRYMVVIAAAAGFLRVGDLRCRCIRETPAQSKFGTWHAFRSACSTCSSVWFELRFARKPLLLFGMLGAVLFIIGVIVGIVAILWRVIGGVGFRPLVNLVETCVTVGGVLFATGLLGEMIAAQRAELSQLRARIEDLSRERDTTSNR